MRKWLVVLALLSSLITEVAVAAPGGWLKHAAGSLGYDRCDDLLMNMAQEGIAGTPVGKNLESSRQLPNKQFLGGFVEALTGKQSRHHTFTVGENQNFLCEGRQVTSYVEPAGCDAFIEGYLGKARFLGDINEGRTRVFANPPYQLYVTRTAKGDSCLVTGIRRFGVADRRSDCAYGDIGGAAAELCLIFRGAEGPVLSLKLDDQPVLLLREDLTDRFQLSHPAHGKGGEPVVIAGHCRPEYADNRLLARTCTLRWGERELFREVRLGAEAPGDG